MSYLTHQRARGGEAPSAPVDEGHAAPKAEGHGKPRKGEDEPESSLDNDERVEATSHKGTQQNCAEGCNEHARPEDRHDTTPTKKP
ncbi:hypothetical protein B0W47_00095 [Komagataeibacter nataicola]|uniref:Uncharacterized protein n=1 Tax=Komagataeibacter nataicola TaxID=265960 RepID=A0A9N7GYX9_9PROT|nr:hypothetical protein [Komagataeibacter nataicola]AQU86112.1 hypothetical protein B0W47_00095 [Komagataeibacter nataicola]PYD67326.1 hypothetical protein CDI09_03665 [Komagataeibacter nataicola]WEQ56951.1 hypothetical protein LV564_07800 [Komagataeibacter nataicola]WNM08479.1 hypothetical protein RI056_16820 [Komagataeibacter nataicola]GBR20598.1 hypothetical protein AA0616_1829 [Komagataeibacter nataicola NRIC 0616]